ncbi:MAG: hypothetical protein U9N02_07135 [Campylobacterota bacterium]|nr:hypothetical protein [Campylobacterota bacterium]
MKITQMQIEQNVKNLITDFSKDTFIFDLLLAYGEPKATISRLKNSDLNYLDSKLKQLKPHYRFASNNIHCGASSLYSHISLPNELTSKLLFGASDYGIYKPLQLSSKALTMIITNFLLSNTENIERMIEVLLLEKINIEIEEILININNQLFGIESTHEK